MQGQCVCIIHYTVLHVLWVCRLSFRKIVKGGQKLNVEKFGGGDMGLVSSAHQLSRGVWGHAPPGIFLGI